MRGQELCFSFLKIVICLTIRSKVDIMELIWSDQMILRIRIIDGAF